MNKGEDIEVDTKEATKQTIEKPSSDGKKKISIKNLSELLPIGIVALVVIMLLVPTLSLVVSRHNQPTPDTNNSIDKTVVEEDKKIREEEIIWDVLGIESSLENTENLADKKLRFSESESLIIDSELTRHDKHNNFYVITEDITLKSGIKEEDWGKYVINDDGVLYKDRKKSEGGIGMTSTLNKEAENSSWYSSYGILYLMQNLDIISNLGTNEKYSYQELKEKEENFMAPQGLFAMWGVYADGKLTTDSETLVIVAGEPMTDEEIESRQAQWNKKADARPYVRITLKNISEVYILNFSFKLNEETQNFVNKWGAAVQKNR